MNVDRREPSPGSVPLDMLRRYLAAHNWQLATPRPVDRNQERSRAAQVLLRDRPSGERNFDIYVSYVGHNQGIELVVPRTPRSSEYDQQVALVIRALSALQDRSDEDVVADIRLVGSDVVQTRIPDAFVLDDAIHLAVARNFVAGIRNVLASAATTEINPAPFFLRQRKEALEYADRCRFGHTFRGSFGFTVESPLEPNRAPPLPGLPSPVPFERRVVERLSRGLTATQMSVEAASIDPLVNNVRLAFSANVCEQFAALVEETTDSDILFKIAYSPEWPRATPELEQSTTFKIGPAHVEAVRAAAKVLRTEIKPCDETVFGRVIRLAGEVNPADLTDVMGEREVAILWSSEILGDVTVRASLTPEDYLSALDAHAQGLPVELSGTLERRGRSWVLSTPTKFSVPQNGKS